MKARSKYSYSKFLVVTIQVSLVFFCFSKEVFGTPVVTCHNGTFDEVSAGSILFSIPAENMEKDICFIKTMNAAGVMGTVEFNKF